MHAHDNICQTHELNYVTGHVNTFASLKVQSLNVRMYGMFCITIRCFSKAQDTTKQKPTVDTQNIKKKESKHTITENHQITKEEIKRRRQKQKKSQKNQRTIKKMAIVSTYLSTISLIANGPNSPIKRHIVAE